MSNAQRYGSVAVLAGGPSHEAAISRQSGTAVFQALRKAGCEVSLCDLSEDIFAREIMSLTCDIAFIALHGAFGEDGRVQTMLEGRGIAYTGSGAAASACAFDKVRAHEVFVSRGLPVPFTRVVRACPSEDKNAAFRFPCVVKPARGGSSMGLTIARDTKGLHRGCQAAFRFGEKVLCQEYVHGREITVGIVNNTPLPVLEIIPAHTCYDYAAKYTDAHTRYEVPARLDRRVYQRAQDLACAAHSAFGCRDFSRVDMIINEEGRVIILELNTIPGLTARSLLPKAAEAAGICFRDLCLDIVKSAWMRANPVRNEKSSEGSIHGAFSRKE